jgi:hypothetical protein
MAIFGSKPTTKMEHELDLFDFYNFTNARSIILSYKGPLTDVILAEIGKDIRSKFTENPTVKRKMFAVFMELAQNILYYSADKLIFNSKEDGVGIILLCQTDATYTFSFANVVQSEHLPQIQDKIDQINTMNRDELRELKRQQRNQPPEGTSKGAGIGLIQAAILSGNQFDIKIRKIDDERSFLTLSVSINK